jgi:hypothetical protein
VERFKFDLKRVTNLVTRVLVTRVYPPSQGDRTGRFAEQVRE